MDTSNYRPVSRRSDLVLGMSTIVIFIGISLFSSLEKALACAIIFGVFLSIVQTRLQRQNDRRFWAIIAILAIIHIIALWLIHIPELRFGLMSLPFALADGFAMWGLINWIERRFPRASDKREP